MTDNRFWRFVAFVGEGFVAGSPWAAMVVNAGQSTTERSPLGLRDDARPPSRRRRRGSQPGVAQECEAFLAGRYYELLLQNHQTMPGWAWVNPLAHAGRTELERLADLAPRRHNSLTLLSYLAEEVLLHAGHDAVTLEQIQREVLVPLELSLLHQPAPIGLSDVATTVARRLERTPAPPPRRDDRRT